MAPHLNTGYSKQLIAKLGQSVTLSTETVSVDHSTDWDNENYVEETDTVDAIVDTPREANAERTETGRSLSADRIVWIADDVAHTIRDGSGDATATQVTIAGVDYVVTHFEDTGLGVYRLEVART